MLFNNERVLLILSSFLNAVAVGTSLASCFLLASEYFHLGHHVNQLQKMLIFLGQLEFSFLIFLLDLIELVQVARNLLVKR